MEGDRRLESLSCVLGCVIGEFQRPFLGPFVGTFLFRDANGRWDIRRHSLSEGVPRRLPLPFASFLQSLRELPDGRATSLLLLHNLLRLVTEESFHLNPDRCRKSARFLSDAYGEKGAAREALFEALAACRVDGLTTDSSYRLASACVRDAMCSHVSLPISTCFSKLIFSLFCSTEGFATESDGKCLESYITFSESVVSVENDSSVTASFGFLLRRCPRSLLSETGGAAVVARLCSMWRSVLGDGDCSESDSDTECANLPVEYLREFVASFRVFMRSLQSQMVKMVLLEATAPSWMADIANEHGILLAHSLDGADLRNFCRRLALDAVDIGAAVTVADSSLFFFDSCHSQGHSASSDTQYLAVYGVMRLGLRINFLHVRVPSGRVVPLYRFCILEGMKLFQSALRDGMVVGGGSVLNQTGALLAADPSHSIGVLGSALRLTALELCVSRQQRLAMTMSPSSGMHVRTGSSGVADRGELIAFGVAIPLSVCRDSILCALSGLVCLLRTDNVLGVKLPSTSY